MMEQTTFFFIFKILAAAVFGGIMGSFLTMLAYRVPRKLSIIAPRSHCPSCQTQLEARDLIPVFSYLLNRGQCRHCKAVIGARYLMIEVTCVVSAVMLAMLFLRG